MFGHLLQQDNDLREAKHALYKHYLAMDETSLTRLIRNQMSRPGKAYEVAVDALPSDVMEAIKNNPVALKALATSGGSALIRQDLEVPLT